MKPLILNEIGGLFTGERQYEYAKNPFKGAEKSILFGFVEDDPELKKEAKLRYFNYWPSLHPGLRGLD